jgi:nucleoid DNA-binding protein
MAVVAPFADRYAALDSPFVFIQCTPKMNRIPRSEIERAVFASVRELLLSDIPVRLTGFGVFAVTHEAARTSDAVGDESARMLPPVDVVGFIDEHHAST